MRKALVLLLMICCITFVCTENASAQRRTHQHYIYLKGERPITYREGMVLKGTAAWYGKRAHGNTTASGSKFSMHRFTAAHRTLPFGTVVRVKNRNNKKSVQVVITDRGPLSSRFIIDLSKGAAHRIDMVRAGIAPVSVEIVSLPSWYGRKSKEKKSR